MNMKTSKAQNVRKMSNSLGLKHKHQQSGIVMIVTLIALALLLLASVALIRSTDANLMIAGHLSFKRDIVNRTERLIPTISGVFNNGVLSTSLARELDNPAGNYSATILQTNPAGIPTVLLDTIVFDSTYSGNNIIDTGGQTTIRYVIDRMCLTTGPISSTSCTLSSDRTDPSGDPDFKVPGAARPLYRISMRVTGPRNTEAYIQTTVTF